MNDLLGLRVLVVEDEGPVAILIEEMLTELGCEVAASAARLADASQKAASIEVDLAILDVNLGGQPVFPVAEILQRRAVPLVFSTGYGASGIPEQFAGHHPVIGKPFSTEELARKISQALTRASQR